MKEWALRARTASAVEQCKTMATMEKHLIGDFRRVNVTHGDGCGIFATLPARTYALELNIVGLPPLIIQHSDIY